MMSIISRHTEVWSVARCFKIRQCMSHSLGTCQTPPCVQCSEEQESPIQGGGRGSWLGQHWGTLCVCDQDSRVIYFLLK